MPYKDPEKRRACMRRCYERNKEKNKERDKEYRIKYYSEHKELMAAKRKQNNHKYREYYRTWKRNFRKKIFAAYGGKCTCCGETIPEFLTIDHINGDGAKHRKELRLRGGAPFYTWLKKNNFPKGYQILCWNCNLGKGVSGVCPHKK